VILNDLMALASSERASNQVRAIAGLKLDQLKTWLGARQGVTVDENHRAFIRYAVEQIKRFQDDPKTVTITRPQDPPDGQPIGMSCDW
jgi:hypothetical protein